MAAADNGNQDIVDDVILADDDRLDFLADALEGGAEFLGLRFYFRMCWRGADVT